MKTKFLSIVLSLLITMVPIYVNAETHVMDLQETLSEEEIPLTFDNYQETDDQIKIYLFRGYGCNHCYDLLKYIESITEEYGYMFKLRSYEVWGNVDNLQFKNEIVSFLDITAPGVPLLIIGEDYYYGYGEKNNEEILNSIKSEYEKEVDTRYDVVAEYKKASEKHLNLFDKYGKLLILISLILFGIAIGFFVIYGIINKNKISV